MSENLSFAVATTRNRPMPASQGNVPNYGRVVERVVRRHPMGISKIARKLQVSRRTVYNWFGQTKIDIDVLIRIGAAIGHDFSVDFPVEFAMLAGHQQDALDSIPEAGIRQGNPVYYWMHKYIKLLERYHETLSDSPL